MRKFVLTMAAAAALMAAGSIAAPRAEAMPVSADVARSVTSDALLQKAAYICRPIWRCGRFGCGWQRVCYFTPEPVFRPRFFGPRWRFHHRHWRGR